MDYKHKININDNNYNYNNQIYNNINTILLPGYNEKFNIELLLTTHDQYLH